MRTNTSLDDGAPTTATVDIPEGEYFRLQNYFWKKTTYEYGLTQTGFRNIRWHPIEVSEEGVAEFGEVFWQPYVNKPYGIILEGRKV